MADTLFFSKRTTSLAQGTLPFSQLEAVSKLVLGIHCLYTAAAAAGRSRENSVTQSMGDTGSPLWDVQRHGLVFSGQIWGFSTQEQPLHVPS